MKSLLSRLAKILVAGQGRPAAAGILLWVIFASLMSEADLPAWWNESLTGQAVELGAKPFKTGRQFLFDGYQKTFPRTPRSQPVTIVAIDEQSLTQIGQWPWPRNRLADLIDAIGQHQPAAVGLDMYMPEADQTSPDRVAANLPPEHAALAHELNKLPSHETRLADALRAVPSVLGAVGFDFASFGTASGMRSVPLNVKGGDPLPFLKNYPHVLASLPELQAAVQGQAMLTVSHLEGGVVRRVPLLVAVNEQPVPSLAMEMLRVASGSSAIEVAVGPHGIDAVQVADLSVPTLRDSEVWVHFARYRTSAARYVSAADVLAGKADPGTLSGKLVLIGLTGSGLSDMRTTVLGDLVPGVEIQAQLMESFFDGRFIQRPWWMKGLETALMGLTGLIMIWFIPRTEGKLAQVLKKSPRAPAWAVMALNVLIVSFGYLAFYSTGVLFDSAAVFIGLSSVLGSLISSAMIQIDRQTKQLDEERQQLREREARTAGELAAARRIQLGSLPDPVTTFAGETRFQLATYLEPARDVGGDLYDFFMTDERHLCFIVGDVSGKGLPASLFMAIAKTLAKSITLRVDENLGAIASLANSELSRENAEQLFVTLLIGLLDVDTGQLSLVNAGHDGPWRIATDGHIEQLTCPPDAGGPPLCVIDDFDYTAQHAQLSPGDTLCLLTDGITEALNATGERYGTKRLLRVLSTSTGEPPIRVVEQIKNEVAGFTAGVEASDDITLLVLRWNGTSRS